ncbi:MAG: hypothetical protein V3V92_04480 [Candidatus Hydrothermarchaeales archaeon]
MVAAKTKKLVGGTAVFTLIAIVLAYQLGFIPLGPSKTLPPTTRAPILITEAPKPIVTPIETPPVYQPDDESTFLNMLSNVEPEACYFCHDEQQTTEFHVPEKIMKIDEARDYRRRICVDCHGPEGADPTEQMTDLKEIHYDPEPGVNGIFEVSVKVPHWIHKAKLLKRDMECMDCHIEDMESFDITFPKADVEDGQVLFCQNCKAESDPHPKRGNYIAIHVEKGGKKCTICHVGDVLDIHKRATEKLGQ